MAFIDALRDKFVKRSPILIFLLGYISSVFGVLTAFLIFPDDVGLMGLAFGSLIMQPFLSKLLANEDKIVYRQKRFSRKLFSDHSQTFKTIFLLFLGVMLAYSTMYLYSNQIRVRNLFDTQLDRFVNTGSAASNQVVGSAITGSASLECKTQFDCFLGISANNFRVMLVALLLSLLYGAGAMLFLSWNASVWGTVFAYYAKNSAFTTGSAKYAAFSELLVRVFPHTFLEASAYFLAVIAGLVISKALLREKLWSPRFNFVIRDGMLFFYLSIIIIFVAAYIEVYLLPFF
ncbi:stage II sporulation protein M [Candidatus Micrarchaeota archaeon]|nr:stage II sporulation protein M [Candidatus Micrarchaeota archaeon]